MDCSLQPGDAPLVRDLLLQHFGDPYLEVEGKLGRRSSKDKFTSGVGAEQFATLLAWLRSRDKMPSCLGLQKALEPEEEVTLDRVTALEVEAEEAASPQPLTSPGGPTAGGVEGRPRRPPRQGGLQVRSSFACDEGGRSLGSPIAVLCKSRLADCHVGRPSAETALPSTCHVDLRVSFSREVDVVPGRAEGPIIHERLKRRTTFVAELFLIQLTHVMAGERESFEVEVELRMDVVRRRLEGAGASAADEALLVTRALVAAMRMLAGCAAEVVPNCRKRKRLDEFHTLESCLRSALEEPEVVAELHRFVHEGLQEDGDKAALHHAKLYLYRLLKGRYATLDEGTLFSFAGQQVGKALRGQQRQTQQRAKEG